MNLVEMMHDFLERSWTPLNETVRAHLREMDRNAYPGLRQRWMDAIDHAEWFELTPDVSGWDMLMRARWKVGEYERLCSVESHPTPEYAEFMFDVLQRLEAQYAICPDLTPWHGWNPDTKGYLNITGPTLRWGRQGQP